MAVAGVRRSWQGGRLDRLRHSRSRVSDEKSTFRCSCDFKLLESLITVRRSIIHRFEPTLSYSIFNIV